MDPALGAEDEELPAAGDLPVPEGAPMPGPPAAGPPPPEAADEPLMGPDSTLLNQQPPGAAAGLMQAGEALGQPGSAQPPAGVPGPNVPIAPPTLPNGQIDTNAMNKQLLGEQAKNNLDAEGAEKAKGAAEVGMATADSQGADEALRVQQQAQQDQQTALANANAKTQAWLDNYQQQADKYQKTGLHDFWQDKSTGDKVLAGLSMLFGAAAQNRPGGIGGENPGMKIIDGAIERDFRLQQANIEKQKSNVDMAKQGYEMGITDKQQALADVNMKKAAALDSTAAQLVSLKMKAGIPLAQATADANVTALRQKANATRLETVGAIHAQNVQDAHLQIEQQRADAMMLRAQKYKTKMGGAAGASNIYAQLAEAAQNGASQADLMRMGAGKIPDKKLVDTVTKLQKDPEKLAEMQFTDLQGNVQTATSARAAKQSADQVAAASAYIDAIREYRDHIAQHGRLINPLSDDYKERERLQANLLARARKAVELGVSKSNMDLEHAAVGGAGTGFSRMSSVASLDKMAAEAEKVAAERVKASTRPGPRFGAGATRVEPTLGKGEKPDASGVTAAQRTQAQQLLQNPEARARLSNKELAQLHIVAGM